MKPWLHSITMNRILVKINDISFFLWTTGIPRQNDAIALPVSFPKEHIVTEANTRIFPSSDLHVDEEVIWAVEPSGAVFHFLLVPIVKTNRFSEKQKRHKVWD